MRTTFCVLVLFAVVVPAPAAARAACGKRGEELRAEVASATAVFVARLEGPTTPVGGLPVGHRGVPDANVSLVVTRAIAGNVRVGERITVRWRGWSEPTDGPIAGGCGVPGTDEGRRYPVELLVVAHGETTSLEVRNDSTSQPIGAANRDLVRRVTRLARQR